MTAATPDWIDALAGQAVQTPAFVYSMAEIASQMRALQAALSTPLLAVVAACNNPDVLARLPEDVRFGARCASRFEMNIVSAWKSEHLYLGMPALDAPSARAVLGGRYKLIIDTPAQLEMLVQLRGARHVTPVTLSLASSLAHGPAPGASSGAGLQGMDHDALAQTLELARRHGVAIGGLQMHAGRHCFGRHGQAVARCLLELVPWVEAQLGQPLQTVNLGGGLEEDWWAHAHDFAAYRRLLSGFAPHVQPMHEPGRAILAAAGVFLTRVVATKRVAGQAVAVCDGGLVQAQALTRANPHWRGTPPRVQRGEAFATCHAATATTGSGQGTLIAGASAGEDDLLAHCEESLQAGDLLAFTGAGAYVQSRSPTHFLGHPPAHAYVRA